MDKLLPILDELNLPTDVQNKITNMLYIYIKKPYLSGKYFGNRDELLDFIEDGNICILGKCPHDCTYCGHNCCNDNESTTFKYVGYMNNRKAYLSEIIYYGGMTCIKGIILLLIDENLNCSQYEVDTDEPYKYNSEDIEKIHTTFTPSSFDKNVWSLNDEYTLVKNERKPNKKIWF